MKISKQELIEMNVCADGLERFKVQTNNTNDRVDIASLVGGVNTYRDILWLASKCVTHERIVKFACDCALINIELIKPYSGHYDLIVDFLNNPITSSDATATACDANDAAARAAYAAYARAADAADAGDVEPVNKLLIELINEVEL